MKKLLVCVLSVMMVAMLSAGVVWADEPDVWTGTEGPESYEVSASVTNGAATVNGEKDFYVTITWSTTNGSYSYSGATYEWDAENTKYVKSQAGSATVSTPAEASIIIANQSNAPVKYEISYESVKEDESDISIETAESGTAAKKGEIASYIESNDVDISEDISGAEEIDFTDAAPSVTYTANVAITGEEVTYGGTGQAKKLGTYTVKISEKPESRTLRLTLKSSADKKVKVYGVDSLDEDCSDDNFVGEYESGIEPASSGYTLTLAHNYIVICAQATEIGLSGLSYQGTVPEGYVGVAVAATAESKVIVNSITWK